MDLQPIVDGVAWVAIAAVLLVYLRQRKLIVPTPYVKPKENIDDPDVTRWRHDGSQTYDWKTGNRAPEKDETAYELSSQIRQ